jgi:hypothetical protein
MFFGDHMMAMDLFHQFADHVLSSTSGFNGAIADDGHEPLDLASYGFCR